MQLLAPRRSRRAIVDVVARHSFLAGFFVLLSASAARAEDTHVGLSDAVKIARSRGYDVLIASTQVKSAEGDLRAAAQLPNPQVNGGAGLTLACQGPCNSGTWWGWYAGISDQGLVEGALSRKRALKAAVAEHARDAAKFGRADVERVLVAQTKIQYVQTAAAIAKLDFSKDVAASLAKSVEVNRVRYPRVIDEGQLARVELEALKADQDVERAVRDLRQQQIELAFLLGRTDQPLIDVDKDALTFRVPEALSKLDRSALQRLALDARPDRKQAIAREQQGEAAIASAKRARFPDTALNVQFSRQGTGDYNSQLPTLTFGATVALPLLYQQQGEIRRAEADREQAVVQRQKIEGSVNADLDSAFGAFLSARTIVQRYESTMLERATRAKAIVQTQYTAGSATLTDLLDSQRSFVQVNVDYNAELVNYWTAVFMLEQAVGKELVP